jgi:hypothetical protein
MNYKNLINEDFSSKEFELVKQKLSNHFDSITQKGIIYTGVVDVKYPIRPEDNSRTVILKEFPTALIQNATFQPLENGKTKYTIQFRIPH